MSLTAAQATLIGSGISNAGGIITNIVNRKNVRESNDLRYKMFREQMHYNDASSQMQRQMAAGLHPMTMAGLQPTDAPTAPDYDTYEAHNPFSGAIDAGINVGQQMLQEKQLALTEKQIDVQNLKTTVDAMNAVTALMGEDATTEEALSMLKRITGISVTDGSEVVKLHRDDTLINSLHNQIESSNISLDEKKYLFGWLDELTNAQYDLLVSQKESNLSESQLNKAKILTEESIQNLNADERHHIQQLTANLAEQWKSLNFQGELDASKLKRVAELSNSLVDDIVNKAKVSHNEATYWVWQKLLENYSPVEIGNMRFGSPFNKTMSTSWNMRQPIPIQKR